VRPLPDHDVVDFLVVQLARARPGHFDLGTGYHGDVWLDTDALFLRPALLRPHVRWLADRLLRHQVDAVCGPLEGGAFLAQAIADALGSAFVPAHRRTRPHQGDAYRLPAIPGGIGGWRVAIVDDAINAGTAVRACIQQVRDAGAVPVAVAALLSLGQARARIEAALPVPYYAVGTIPSQVWPTGRCPLCAGGVALTDPA
jgi:orotate phosphoribosyltransferase